MIIYQYTTTANEKCYVGQHTTDNLVRYFKADLSRAAKGDTRKPALYNAMRAYPGTWSARVLVRIPDDKERLNQLEQFFIRWFESSDKRNGYNISAGGGGSFGYTKVISEETRLKMAAASRGRKHSAETLAKMSERSKGRPKTPEHRANISKARMGKKTGPFPPEHRENMRLSRLQAGKRYGASKFKGVHRNNGKWRACITLQKGKRAHLGYFEDEVLAAKAYDAAAKFHFGNNAGLNFPE